MAKEVKNVEEVVAPKSAFKFYRSRIAGLKIIVQDAENNDPTTIKYVRFSPKREKYQGDWIKVGYLKTDNEIAINKLVGDPNVTELTEKEYSEAVK